MDMIATRARSLGSVLAMIAERMLIPLAVVVGLTGGAMIGSEIARLQAPPTEIFH